ncbi:hypothetical protein A4A49_05899 [Nicotiana attenuata]|uniref:Uncharacterized protein n=1 Tax=Nicotiana attenuata TaxID=49451 RepID=A0A314L877_NICAT|nr:hypothetical protein A4A49_05899 [Nicotiana attenuata]
MEKGGNIQNSQSPNICNRVFNFIINIIWVTMGNNHPTVFYDKSTNQVPIESPTDLNGDIEIEFRHLEIVGGNNKEKGTKKFVSIKEIAQERSETKQIPGAARRRPNSLNVTSNINEKTEAFINSKKEALRRSYTENDKKA